MPDIKLKPCPFCGGDAVLAVDTGMRVLCKHCGAQTEKRYANNSDDASFESAFLEIVTAWNRRANDE